MRLPFLFPLLLAAFVMPATLSAQLAEVSLPNLTVLADRALSVPLTKLVNQFSQIEGASITVTYAPSFEQTIAIQEGEPADLFISAQPQSIAQLKQRGLLAVESLRPLVYSRLVMIYSDGLIPQASTDQPASLAQALQQSGASFLAIASPMATAEGYYSKQVIDRLQPKDVPIAEMPDTESIYYQLRRSKEPAAAILFETDAALYEKQFQSVNVIPEELHDPALFISAVIPGGNMELSRKLQDFLTKEIAQREFIKHQFYPVAGQ